MPQLLRKSCKASRAIFITSHVRATICSICVCIWSTTSPYSNTRSIFVRIWTRRCVICRPNVSFCMSNVRLWILVNAKRRCLRTDVIVSKTDNNNENPRFAFFRHLNFYFRLFFKYIRVSLFLGCGLSHSVLALITEAMFVYTDLKSTLTIHEFLLYLR